ncbi:MAG: cell division protein FtsQ/DivIB [Caulobacterales bacterium]
MAAVKGRRANGPNKGRGAPPPPPMPKLAAAHLHRPRPPRDEEAPRRPISHARAFVAGSILFAGVATAGAAFFGGQLYDFRESAAIGVDQTLANAGLRASDIRVPNLDARRAQEVEALVLPERRLSMFAADPDEVKARVESLDWVDSAQVQRLWPNTIRVEIIKRRAIARWQENGSVTLIDEAGERVHDSRGIDSSHLPLIVGRGAGPAAQSVLSALDEMPEIRARLRALVRVGDRRWDARLAGGVSVALPEAYPERALAALERLHAERGVLDLAIARIDMRQPSIMTVTPTFASGHAAEQGA